MIALINFCCQKTTNNIPVPPENPKVIDGHIKNLTKINSADLPSFEKSVFNTLGGNWNLKEIETVDYTFSNMRAYSIKNFDNSNLSLIIVFNKGKYFKVLYKKERVSDNLEKVKLTSPDGVEYLNFMLMDDKYISHLKGIDKLPFRSILSQEEMADNKRVMGEQDVDQELDGNGCADLTFASCIECAFRECANDWKCTIMCGLGAGPGLCMIAWTIGCS